MYSLLTRQIRENNVTYIILESIYWQIYRLLSSFFGLTILYCIRIYIESIKTQT